MSYSRLELLVDHPQRPHYAMKCSVVFAILSFLMQRPSCPPSLPSAPSWCHVEHVCGFFETWDLCLSGKDIYASLAS
jgi:hypothetical protein